MNSTVKVWDPLVRLLHWPLALLCAAAWISGDAWKGFHLVVGYIAFGIVALRCVWGVIGSGHARFASFVKGPGATLGYLADIARGRERRHLGHNPAGAAMIVALLLTVAGLGITGWMYGLDRFWGDEWLEETHAFLANFLVFLVAFHLIGVLVASLRHHENLPLAMITGEKRAPEAEDAA